MNEETRHRIESNLALVEHIVARMSARFPDHIERDDLVQAGMVALVETANRYDPEPDIAFSAVAGPWIVWAILDVIRGDDWLPRSVRVKARELAAIEEELLQRGSEMPDDRAIAAAADMTTKELSILRSGIRRGVVMALDRPVTSTDGPSTLGGMIADDDAKGPIEGLEEAEMKTHLRSAIHRLPERHRLVLIGYFLDGRSMGELAALLYVTPPQILQIKEEALRQIRESLAAQYEELDAAAIGPRPAFGCDATRRSRPIRRRGAGLKV